MGLECVSYDMQAKTFKKKLKALYPEFCNSRQNIYIFLKLIKDP